MSTNTPHTSPTPAPETLELTLTRAHFFPTCCIGDLTVDDAPECFTLEDTVRNPGSPKVAGATAIPYGRYRVVIDQSVRFHQPMPHILDVPGFDGIRIHSGNTSADTEGCVLLGSVWNIDRPDWIGGSHVAFEAFAAKLREALAVGKECWITVQAAKTRSAKPTANATTTSTSIAVPAADTTTESDAA